MPLFSIITVCYNSEKTIERTLNSVLSQTCQDYEYIIIDGRSTDNTLNIINSFKERFGDKLRIVSEPDKGIYDAMNKGIRISNGLLVGIVNSDDFYEPDTLEKVKEVYLKDEKYQIVYGMIRYVDKCEQIEEMSFIHHRMMEQVMIHHPTCFITKAIYDDKGLYSLEYRSSSDYDFLLKMFYDPEVIFTPVYSVLSNFTRGGESSKLNSHIETFKIWKKYGCISTKRYFLILISTYAKELIG